MFVLQDHLNAYLVFFPPHLILNVNSNKYVYTIFFFHLCEWFEELSPAPRGFSMVLLSGALHVQRECFPNLSVSPFFVSTQRD